MILQIRATSGGGKTTVMRHLMELANTRPTVTEKTARGEKVLINEGRWDGRKFFVIGPYPESGTGGCDRINGVEKALKLVDQCASPSAQHIVCFEGLLLAHSWGQMGEFLHAKYRRRYRNMFIDTSAKQCFRNVMKRRSDNSDPERIAKIEKNVIADHYRVELAWKRVAARGGSRIMAPYKQSREFAQQYIDDWCNTMDWLF